MTDAGERRPMRRAPGRPVGADAVQTRAHIMRVGAEIINERGFAALTFQGIARRSGLSRPTLNYYFATKDELFTALVHEGNAVVQECIAAAKQQEDPLDRLRALLDALADGWNADPTLCLFLVNARLEARRNPALPDAIAVAIGDFLDDVVGDAVADGILPANSDPALVCELLHAMLWGIGLWCGYGGVADPVLVTKQLDMVISGGLPDDARRAS
ncbi:TetR/AcrR family transcriptional regulator [Mycolicibacterium goodii]|uniref:TetR/AcrR family transcriptional regulator n=1 Tax=Mycolicibacterium goodii TaxID=134601 RepID=A0ABS6HHQ9_MYCGD|nr:TetR/AcrR family transcriptional regulator [Mycolicibacterium goodii]MBU8822226.1 TetR/AcrR family transcriptional regulator [Mycolicibacterium goodii]MBU8831832.1 TetR/AcrR family transcriptional regulator [Mycolicibacterium goodii]MBU8834817.1 TetR/AcrR family transcriptional regulator [Mycolicibacterium goodii]